MYFLQFYPEEQSRLKRKAKGAAATKPVAARGGGSSGSGDGGSGVYARSMRRDMKVSVALEFVRFYRGGQGAKFARACEAYLAVSKAAPPRHVHGRPLGPLFG